MILDAANLQPLEKKQKYFKGLLEKEEFFERWIEHLSSSILHREQNCCEEARLWFLAYAHSMELGSTAENHVRPPTWLGQRFTWGPSPWPIAWCELLKEKTLDCGVFAALAREVFKAQGVQAHPAQVLISYNDNCTDHWKDLWKKDKSKTNLKEGAELFPWVGKNIVYHEVCALELEEGKARIYDSTFGHWFEPHKRTGFGALLAVRVECPRLFSWGNKLLSYGEWQEL